METLRLHRMAVGRLAALALLLALLAPALSHALSPALGDVWGSVCSAQGDKPAPLRGAGDASTGASVLDHCPCCTLQLVALLPPPAGSQASFDPKPERVWSAAAGAASSRPSVWAPAWPRAPPLA